MIVTGSGGFAKQLLEAFIFNDENICFFDNITGTALFENKFRIITSLKEAKEYLHTVDSRFALGVGDPINRSLMTEKFSAIGGKLTSIISPSAFISSFNVNLSEGVSILARVYIEPSVRLGKGVLVNVGSVITHDNIIDSFTEIGPGVTISGSCSIGSFCRIGAGATIIPKVKIGNNVVIAAGSVVIKDIPDNVLVAGNPAAIKKQL